MSTSYSFVKGVNDESSLFTYVSALYPTLVGVSSSGSSLRLTFSSPLAGAQQTALTSSLSLYPDPVAVEDATLANLLVLNTSSAPLAANATFAGGWEDVSRFSRVRVSCLSDAASAASGVQLQFGLTARQADSARTYAAAAGAVCTCVSEIAGRYFRVVYANGPAPQTSFACCARWATSSEPPLAQLGSPSLADQTDAALTRSVLSARQDSSRYANLRADEQNRLLVRASRRFERDQSVSSTPWIQVSFTYGINSDNCVTSLAGSGTVTASASRALVSSGAAAGGSATLSTDRVCMCGPGNTVMAVAAACFGPPVAGNVQVAGAATPANGLLFGYNGTSFGVACRSNSVTTWVPQASWNVNRCDGSGTSGVVLNPLLGNTYAVQYDATGWGSATFMLLSPNTPNANTPTDDFLVVHRQFFNNVGTATGLLNPQFPLCAASSNATATAAVTVAVAGLCAFVESDIRNSLMYSIDAYRSITATTPSPMLVLYNKPAFGGVASTTTVLLREINVAVAAGSRNLVLTATRDAALTGVGTLTDVSTTGSCVSYSVVATAIAAGTGVAMYCATLYGNNERLDVTSLGIYISPGSTLALSAKLSTAGSNNTTVTAVWSEI